MSQDFWMTVFLIAWAWFIVAPPLAAYLWGPGSPLNREKQ